MRVHPRRWRSHKNRLEPVRIDDQSASLSKNRIESRDRQAIVGTQTLELLVKFTNSRLIAVHRMGLLLENLCETKLRNNAWPADERPQRFGEQLGFVTYSKRWNGHE